MKDRATAFHEAGHAVTAHALGRGIVEVSILPDDDNEGHVRNRRRRRTWAEKIEEANYDCTHGRFIDARLRRGVEIDIMIDLAGGLAASKAMGIAEHETGNGMVRLAPDDAQAMAEKYGGTFDYMIVGGDLHHALELASMVSGSDEEASAYLDWLEQRTRNLLSAWYNWAGVEGLAERLLTEPTMSRARCRQVIQDAMREDASDFLQRVARSPTDDSGAV